MPPPRARPEQLRSRQKNASMTSLDSLLVDGARMAVPRSGMVPTPPRSGLAASAALGSGRAPKSPLGRPPSEQRLRALKRSTTGGASQPSRASTPNSVVDSSLEEAAAATLARGSIVSLESGELPRQSETGWDAVHEQIKEERDLLRREYDRLKGEMQTATAKQNRELAEAYEEIGDLKKLVAELTRDVSHITAQAERAEKLSALGQREGDELRAAIRELRAERVQLEAELTGQQKNLQSLTANLRGMCDVALPVVTQTSDAVYTVCPERAAAMGGRTAQLARLFVVLPFRMMVNAFTHLDLDRGAEAAGAASLSTLGGHLAQVVGWDDPVGAAGATALCTPAPSLATPLDDDALAPATPEEEDLPPPQAAPHPPDYHSSVAAILERVAGLGLD
eukprot:TRINITY_DN24969_c0_g1_i1.p1 TRINITY_DN24969_c0_g1~~TRINITY_DN24969_c0_g1_i1.p1  ORF type:complete len:394 (+),score=113.06 TRINITY_DN24969_c0_g1_i1:58-1239(+)